MFDKYFKAHYDTFYVIFRVLIGLLFLVHGLQKFGVLSERPAAALMSMFGAAGVIEIVVGTLITVGLFSRLAALLGGLEMIAAYFIAHWPKGAFPYQNGGEAALLFLAAFLVIIVNGSQKASLEKLFCKKECF